MRAYRTSHISDTLKKLAGDQWSDEATGEFMGKLFDAIMASDTFRGTGRDGNDKLYFDYTFNGRRMPFLATLSEFGYGETSESISATITSPGNPGFRLPGGFTKTRDAQELLQQMEQYLEEIFVQALGQQ